MDIKHEQNGRRGEFYIAENDDRVARLEYSDSANGEMTIVHTEVDEKLRGKHVGDALVKTAVEFARENHKKVVAQCPFAAKVIERHSEYQDVLA